MTAARDELAALIRERCWPRWRFPETPESTADAILAAGWRAPEPPCDHTGIVHVTYGGKCMRCSEQITEPMTLPEIEAEVREQLAAPSLVTPAMVLEQIRQESDDDADEYGEWEKIHIWADGEPFAPGAVDG